MSDLAAVKEAARKAGYERRKVAHAAAHGEIAAARLLEFLEPHAGQTISGYMPIRTEIDPLGVMAKMVTSGFVTVPVIKAAGLALKFRQWAPDVEMVAGPFGAKVPATGAWLEPEVLIVPLIAFDRSGGRLGYGGGFYDRTLEMLRGRRKTIAVGFAYGAQEATKELGGLPLEATDQPLDAIVTERETLVFG
ncbi:MAG: 5-formyltetrahydrofolate cyclo-ligase [Marinosulfonomonas sp.]|nr:5-formyltetrahydrofolate cyclo-ligase [Marinosulfonomonas sp.]